MDHKETTRLLYGDDYVRLEELRQGFREGRTGTIPLSDAVALLVDAELQRRREALDIGDED